MNATCLSDSLTALSVPMSTSMSKSSSTFSTRPLLSSSLVRIVRNALRISLRRARLPFDGAVFMMVTSAEQIASWCGSTIGLAVWLLLRMTKNTSVFTCVSFNSA